MNQFFLKDGDPMECSTEKNPEEIRGKVLALGNLVDYQEGSIVSREIIRKKTGTITLFAFDKGQGLSEHTTPFDALVFVLEGKAKVTISGRALPVNSGEMVIMPAHEPHAIRAVTSFKMLLVMIRE